VISVDSSVWIELLRATGSKHDLLLRSLIEEDAPLAISEIVLAEVLAGVPREREVKRVRDVLLAFPSLELCSPQDFLLAASLHRRARRTGQTVRGSVDCLIAAPCVRRGIPLLHADADFDRLAACTPLQVFPHS